jgi:hypothetical protein
MYYNPQQLVTSAYAASNLRPQFAMTMDDWFTNPTEYCLDAPEFIPCGGGLFTQSWFKREGA